MVIVCELMIDDGDDYDRILNLIDLNQMQSFNDCCSCGWIKKMTNVCV
jgi:hypothetical protein